MHPRARQLILVIALSFAVFPTRAAPERYWERFPTPGYPSSIQSLGIDANGGLWALTWNGVYCWDSGGKTWELASPRFSRGEYTREGTLRGYSTARFLQTSDRLYLLFCTAIREESPIQVYELKSGKAKLLTEVESRPSSARWHLWGCRDGRLLNCYKGKLRVYARGAWKEWDLGLNGKEAVVLDCGGPFSCIREVFCMLLMGRAT